jgi:acetyl esterase/lipase
MSRTLRLPIVIAALWAGLIFFSTAQLHAEEALHKVESESDIIYGRGGETDLKLDLARPADLKSAAPAVVCIHGGGWRGGKRQDLTSLTKYLAERGYVAATITYRLTPQHRFPAQIEDCKAAVRWVRANAKKYNINPDKIGAIGFSAGGHLSCMLGTTDANDQLEGSGGNPEQSSRVQAVVSYFGPTDFTTKDWSENVEETFLIPLTGSTFEEKPEAYKRASPLVYATKDDAPTLFFHGDRDVLVQVRQSKVLADKLKELGVDSKLEVLQGEGHGWSGKKLDETLATGAKFFDEKLKQ